MALRLHLTAVVTLCWCGLTVAAGAQDLPPRVLAAASAGGPQGAAATLAVRPAESNAPCVIHIRVSRRLIAPLFEREVVRQIELDEQILDTRVRGTSRTVGATRLVLIPDPHQAVFDVVFGGQSVAETQGTNEWVVAPSRTLTSLAGQARIVYDGHQLRALPSQGSARAQIQVTSVRPRRAGLLRKSIPRGFIERAGWRQLDRTLALREQIVSRRSVARLRRFLDRDVAAQIAHSEFPRQLIAVLENAGLSSQQVKVSSSSTALHLALQLPDSPAGPGGNPPPLHDLDPDLLVCVHQSAVDHVGHHLLSGALLNQGGISRDGRQIFSSEALPAQLQLTLDPVQPIGIRFVDGLLDLTLNSSHCSLIETPLPGFGVHMRCRLQPTEAGLRTELVGLPRVTPHGPHNWSLAMIPLKQMVERALASHFADRLLTKSVWQIGELNEPALRPTYANSEHGWLTLAWSRRVATPVQSLVADQATP